ncbi:MAG: glycosyltransferase family 4 protein [Firmicutes bacterium]|nr:glycosyltransferase family 4 protein [Bacillota bacterium]
MVRLLWEGPFFRPLSLDKVNRELCLAALQRGHEVLVRPTDPLDDVDAVARNIGEWRRLQSLISGFEPADWHVRHTWPPYWNTACGPLIINQPWELGVIPEEWVDPLLHRVHRVVVPSLAVQEMFLASGIPENKLSVIPNGINPAVYHPFGHQLTGEPTPHTVFLWVGGFLPRKGLDVLVKAYCQAFHRHDDVLLVVKAVGRTSSYRHAAMPDALLEALDDPTAPAIRVILDDLPEEDMAALYRSATCLVSPYRGEGFNMPVLEAMAAGCLVVASDTNPTNEFVPSAIGWRIPGERHYDTVSYSSKLGWHFEPDPEALVELLRQVANLPREERGWRQEAGRRWVLEHYTWSQIWKQWELLLQDPPVKNRWFAVPKLSNTIIWRGPVRNASGFASEARSFLKALPMLGIIPRIIDDGGMLSPSTVTNEEERLFGALERVPVTRSTVQIHSVPGWATAPPRHGAVLVRTMFETNALPESWVARLNHMSAVLVPSTFNRETFVAAGISPDKISVVPSPVDTDLYRPPRVSAHRDRLHFISLFHWTDRKGWDVLIKAWARAFRANDPVALTIKTTRLENPQANPREDITHLLAADGYRAEDVAPIQVILESWSEAQIAAFYQSGDVFVLPTRGEGWGRPILEAMATGLLVIATNWSGPTDFLRADNALLLDAKAVIPVSDQTDTPIFHGHYWAEPDLDQLVSLLRWAVDHYPDTEGLRRQARLTAEQYHPHKVAAQLVDVLRNYGVTPSQLTFEGQ